MKTVEEVRRARLAMLLLEFGSYVALNDLLGLNARDSTLSQIANQSENKKSGTKKQMGPDIARDLERVCKKERGWMDTDPDIWPFSDIDHQKVVALLDRHRHQLEGALLLTAAEIGLDIQKSVGV